MILGSLYEAANTVLTRSKRGVITSLPETFFLTFPDNLWNLWSVDVQFWFWTEQQTLQRKLHDELTEIIRKASVLLSLEEGKEVSSLWSHSVCALDPGCQHWAIAGFSQCFPDASAGWTWARKEFFWDTNSDPWSSEHEADIWSECVTAEATFSFLNIHLTRLHQFLVVACGL